MLSEGARKVRHDGCVFRTFLFSGRGMSRLVRDGRRTDPAGEMHVVRYQGHGQIFGVRARPHASTRLCIQVHGTAGTQEIGNWDS